MEYTHAYIGKANCGCVVAAVVDMPDKPKSTAEDVAEFVKNGYIIERIEIGNGIQMRHCPHSKEISNDQKGERDEAEGV